MSGEACGDHTPDWTGQQCACCPGYEAPLGPSTLASFLGKFKTWAGRKSVRAGWGRGALWTQFTMGNWGI